MTKPTPYNSQIDYTPKKHLNVDFRNQPWRNTQLAALFGGILFLVISLISLFFQVSLGSFEALFFCVGFFSIMISLTTFVNKGFLLNYGKISYFKFGTKRIKGDFIKYSPFLDFKIKMLKKGMKVTFLDVTFKLDSVKDLPILTDAVVELLDLTFYENYQLTDKTEILTYRGNRIVRPIFPSFLNLQRTPQKVKCVDIIGGNHLITVDNFSTPSNKLWIGKRDRRVFTKDVKRITICFQPILWGFRSFIWLRVEKNYQPSKFKILAFFQKLINQRIAFTGLRSRKDELTNIRDTQEFYSHLQLLDSLKHVEFIKK